MAAETALALARKAAQHLERSGLEQARLEAELLLADILGLDRLQLYLQHDRPVDPQELERFRTAIRRRLKREPVQYILGRAAFRHLDLAVDQRVLIPRPETEVLVEQVLKWAAEHGGRSAVDLGCGSGAIALSLVRESAMHVVATDVSAAALEVARENADRNGITDRIEFRVGELFQPLGQAERFDVIVSNPPYIAEHEAGQLPPEVVGWEPATALFAGADGLAVIRPLIFGADQHLNRPGLLALELGASQAPAVEALVRESRMYARVSIVRDLTGRERIVLAQLD